MKKGLRFEHLENRELLTNLPPFPVLILGPNEPTPLLAGDFGWGRGDFDLDDGPLEFDPFWPFDHEFNPGFERRFDTPAKPLPPRPWNGIINPDFEPIEGPGDDWA